MTSYVVLRNLNRLSTGGPFDDVRTVAAAGLGTTAATEPAALDLALEQLDRREVAEIAREPEVVAVSPAMPTKLIEPFEAGAGAAAAGDAWGIAAVLADTSPFDGQGTTVAVLDTGIDNTHPAFAGVALTEQDFSGSGNGDKQGHGTHCAGTIFGGDVGGERIGVARGVQQALIGKVLDDNGSGSSEMVFSGIQWALAQGADVISMSLGFDFPGLVAELVNTHGWPPELATSAALEAYRANLRMFDALMAQVGATGAFRSTALVIAAAGNESRRELDPDFEIAASLPAAAEGVVSVGAVQQSPPHLRVTDFSNTFPQVSAPGFEIKSARAGGGTRLLSGTSMACPHVAGIAALWWEFARSASSRVPPTAQTVMTRLLSTARTNLFAPNTDDVADRGAGVVTAPQ